MLTSLLYRQITADQELDDIRSESISIFIQETLHVVPDLASVVTYGKFGGVHPRPWV